MSDAKAVIAEVLDKRGVPGSPRTYRADASAILSALAAAGLAVVPVTPTEAMLQAAHSALYRWRETQGDPQQDPTNEQKHAIRYGAMLAAATTGDAT